MFDQKVSFTVSRVFIRKSKKISDTFGPTRNGSPFRRPSQTTVLLMAIFSLLWVQRLTPTSGQNLDYSPNNRGYGKPEALINLTGRLQRIGRRADLERKELVWSQPDPRKSYSLPVKSFVGLVRRGAGSDSQSAKTEENRKEYNKLPIVVQPPSGSSVEREGGQAGHNRMYLASSRRETSGGGLAGGSERRFGSSSLEGGGESAESAGEPASDGIDEQRPAGEREAESQPSIAHSSGRRMVTLIKYVPVLMSVPAEQLVLPQLSGQSQLASVVASGGEPSGGPLAARGAAKQEELAGQEERAADEPSRGNLLDRVPSQQRGQEKLFEQNKPQPAGKLVPGYLAAAGQAQQPPPSGPSKALSAATRLISMLRPSALLSSIQQQPVAGQQALAGQHQHGLQALQSALYQLPGQAHIYLLSPAEDFLGQQQRANKQHQSSFRVGLQPASSPEELLLNQASRVHQSAPVARRGNLRQERLWYHQQRNGVICIHQSAEQAPAASPLLVEPLRLAASPAYTLLEQAAQPAAAKSQPASAKQLRLRGGLKEASKRPAWYQTGGRPLKESPGKLAKKLKGSLALDKGGGAAEEDEQQQSVYEDSFEPEKVFGLEEERSRQPKQAGKSPPSKSPLASGASSQLEPTGQLPTASSEAERKRPLVGGAIIPFTIRDKIEPPAWRRWPAGGSGSVGAGTNSPVQFDDQPSLEGAGNVEVDVLAAPSTARESSKRARTSFVSSAGRASLKELARPIKTSAKEREPHLSGVEIEYRKEGESRKSAYTLPLLMASSTNSVARVNSASPGQPGATLLSGQPPLESLIATSTSSFPVGQEAGSKPERLRQALQAAARPTNKPGKEEPRRKLARPAGASTERPAVVNNADSGNKTVDFYVHSSPPEGHAPATTSLPISDSKSNKTSLHVAENHSPEADGNLFSNDNRLLSSSDDQQFGRIFESLQTNPLDLIDLQNSRSNFELPSQLESLSMFLSDKSGLAGEASLPAASRHSTGRSKNST